MSTGNEELILEIQVQVTEPYEIKGHSMTVVCVPFGGTVKSPYFQGKVMPHGVDTQKFGADGVGHLSARYTLEGTDCEGQNCRIFIENEGDGTRKWHPSIVTDSKALAHWETAENYATVDPIDGGVCVKIYLVK